MAEADEDAAYARRLQHLHADAELWNRLKDFHHDLVAFKNSKRALLRLLQEPTAQFYMSSVYFSPDQAHALLSFKRSDGLTLQQALELVVARKVRNARDGSAVSFALCTSHDLAPVFHDHFSMRKCFEADKLVQKHGKNQRKRT